LTPWWDSLNHLCRGTYSDSEPVYGRSQLDTNNETIVLSRVKTHKYNNPEAYLIIIAIVNGRVK